MYIYRYICRSVSLSLYLSLSLSLSIYIYIYVYIHTYIYNVWLHRRLEASRELKASAPRARISLPEHALYQSEAPTVRAHVSRLSL